MRLSAAVVAIQLSAAAVCAAQSSSPPAPPAPFTNGVELDVGSLHAIALDIDQRRDRLYCYFGTRVLTTGVRVHVDSVTAVATADECGGVGLGFIVRGVDRELLIQMLRGVIESNPRFAVVSAFYGTHDIDRFGDTVRVARPVSVLRGATALLTHNGSS